MEYVLLIRDYERTSSIFIKRIDGTSRSLEVGFSEAKANFLKMTGPLLIYECYQLIKIWRDLDKGCFSDYWLMPL